MGERLTAERRQALAELLAARGSVRTSELAARLGVSRETIRKDLQHLQAAGMAQVTRGGALPAEQPLSLRATAHREAKVRLAQAAAARIPDGATVLLDAGSTTHEIARQLALRRGLTVVTHSAAIPAALAGAGHTVYALGGELRGNSLACVGMWTLRALETIHADLAVLSADGCLGRGGPSTTVYAEAEIKTAMTRRAREVLLVCDASKLARESVVQFCPWSDVDLLLTEASADEALLERLRGCVQVELVP